jgi:V8-like Glu-specific endopeptidase
MIGDYPVDWTDPHVRALLGVLESVYRMEDIESIVSKAGLRMGDVAVSARSALTWRSVYDLAAGNLAVDALLEEVAAFRPVLRLRIDELREPAADLRPDTLAATVPTAPDYASPSWKNFSVDGQAEAVIVAGQPTFLEVVFLAIGLERARSVCRLATRFPAEGWGTAFRIGARHLLTNHHVLYNHDDGDKKVRSVEAWFNFEEDERGKPRDIVSLACDVSSIVGEKPDDWAVIETADPIPDVFPALPIVGARVPQVDDRVCIIQHPGGQTKKVALQHNLVRDVDTEKIQYWTDTDLGSSGSPVFDDRWDVVALHHFSVPAPQGDRVGVRNQGRRIDRIVERMVARGVGPGDIR